MPYRPRLLGTFLGAISFWVLVHSADAISSPACLEGARKLSVGSYVFAHTLPDNPPLNTEFSFNFSLCRDDTCPPPSAELIAVTAEMPDHKHGTNRRALVTNLGSCWKAEGMILHMPGRWRVSVDFKVDGRIFRSSQDVLVD